METMDFEFDMELDLAASEPWVRQGFSALFEQYDAADTAVTAANDDSYDNLYPFMA